MNKRIKIALLGDSWGVPNYYGGSGPVPHHHIEWLLRFQGDHVVTNFSRNGGSNLETLERLYDSFDIGYKCDLVIWFHTEPIRDSDDQNIVNEFKLQELNDSKAVTAYKFAQQVKYKSDCKWLVIGGQAPINKELFDKFHIGDFVKYDWRSELVGKYLPETPAWGRKEFLESDKWVDSTEDKNIWLEKHLEVKLALQDCDLFPDNGHPGAEAHEQLYKYIEKKILGNL